MTSLLRILSLEKVDGRRGVSFLVESALLCSNLASTKPLHVSFL